MHRRRAISLLLLTCVAGCASVPLGALRRPLGRKRVLVAGATGRTGSAIRLALREKGYDVLGLTRNVERAVEKHGGDWTWIEGDVRDPVALDQAMAGVDYVICAIGAREISGPNSPEFVDYGGVQNLVEAAKAHNVKHFVLISSAAAGPHRERSTMTQMGQVRYWKTLGESVLKLSGLSYTIIGPGGLEEEPETTKGLRVMPRSAYGTGLIAIGDVAMLAVHALRDPNAKFKTFAAIWDDSVPRKAWRDMLAEIEDDALTAESPSLTLPTR